MTAYELLKGKGQEGTESDDDKAEFFRAIHLHSTRAMPTLTSLCPSMPPELSALIKKALALDPDERYNNFCALLHDLHKVKQICEGTLRGPARRDFIVGHIDYQSRFAIPPGLLDREEEFAMLDEAYRLVKATGQSQVACCWGVSGSGKSKLLELWARRKEADNAGQDCFVSWAKVSLPTYRLTVSAADYRDHRWTNISSSPFRPSSLCSAPCLSASSVIPSSLLPNGVNGSSIPWLLTPTYSWLYCPKSGVTFCWTIRNQRG